MPARQRVTAFNVIAIFSSRVEGFMRVGEWNGDPPVPQIILCLILLLATPALLWAEQLPLKVYTIADGLPRDSISRIVRDSRGFLWFCTPEGLARFDGYQFVSYTTH